MTTLIPGLELDGASTRLAERLSRSLVAVRSTEGGGSGTIWSADGVIITNHHVVAGETAQVVTWDDRVFLARVIARDASHDLAALQIDADGLEALEAGDSAALKAGHVVFAIGNPWGVRGSLTAGIVLAGEGGAGPDAEPRAIRADLRLAPGNSGGPMVDPAGRVVGINSMIVGGMAVAVPVATVQRFLAANLGSQPGFLGVQLQAVPLPEGLAAAHGLGEAGALMLTVVEPGSAAEAAGLLPGDLLLGVEGAPWSVQGVAAGLESIRAGKPVKLSLLRAGQIQETEAVPNARAA